MNRSSCCGVFRNLKQVCRMIPFFFLLGAGLALGAQTGSPESKAEEIGHVMMQAMGGQDAWNQARFVRFDFRVNIEGKIVANRSHLWDKQTGRYRIEDKTKEGQSRIVLFNVGNQQGSAYVDEKRLDGQAAASALKEAYGAFINDLYWLAMPWKWMDSGVRLKYLGKKRKGAVEFDIVELTFENVGLTPGDRYRAFVSPRSNLMEKWEYNLQSGQKGAWDWQYITTEGVKLAKNHTSGGGKSINMGDVRILKVVDDSFFADPNRKLGELK